MEIAVLAKPNLSDPLPGVHREYVGRPSKLGNPFPMRKEADRAKVVEQYTAWLRSQYAAKGPVRKELERLLSIAQRQPLELVCLCPQKLPRRYHPKRHYRHGQSPNIPCLAQLGGVFSCSLTTVCSMHSSIQKFNRWVARNTVLYMVLCYLGCGIIRWYWVGQDIHRFINPLAPIFMPAIPRRKVGVFICPLTTVCSNDCFDSQSSSAR